MVDLGDELARDVNPYLNAADQNQVPVRQIYSRQYRCTRCHRHLHLLEYYYWNCLLSKSRGLVHLSAARPKSSRNPSEPGHHFLHVLPVQLLSACGTWATQHRSNMSFPGLLQQLQCAA